MLSLSIRYSFAHTICARILEYLFLLSLNVVVLEYNINVNLYSALCEVCHRMPYRTLLQVQHEDAVTALSANSVCECRIFLEHDL